MRYNVRLCILALALPLLGQACTREAEEAAMTGHAGIEARMQKYALTPMQMDLRDYSDREKAMIGELLKAAELADEIFWRQTSHVAQPMREQIQTSDPEDNPLRRFFMMQAGPYDRLDHDARFLDDVPPKSAGAAFYPDDFSAEEFGAWIDGHPEDREAFLSPYTVIRRDGERLVAIPYHEAYAEFLEPMAQSLRRAANLAENESFARYLHLKADALLDDQYFDADTAWIGVSGSKFDITIGPFEVYEDALMNIKAAYEASVEIVDQEESAKLEVYVQHLAAMEAALPYDDRYKPESHGLTAAFTIVRDIYRGGDLRVGYQPVAASLPNDPLVTEAVGSKKTFWKNFFEARVNQVILPISRRLVAEDQVGYVAPQAFFDVVLLHEIAHALGPRYALTPKGQVPVNQALTTHYSWIEEAKATVAGLVSLDYLIGAVAQARVLRLVPGQHLPDGPLRYERGARAGRPGRAELLLGERRRKLRRRDGALCHRLRGVAREGHRVGRPPVDHRGDRRLRRSASSAGSLRYCGARVGGGAGARDGCADRSVAGLSEHLVELGLARLDAQPVGREWWRIGRGDETIFATREY